jgi:hypothetical protein
MMMMTMMMMMIMMIMMMRPIKTKKQNTFCYFIISINQLSLPIIIVFAIAMVQNHGPPTPQSWNQVVIFFANERGSIRCS